MSILTKARERHGGDFELNIVPVLDSLVVLISFLLLSATFANIVLLDTTVPTVLMKAIQKSHDDRPNFKLAMTINTTGATITIENEKVVIPNTGGKIDLQSIHDNLVAIKRKHPDRFSIDLNVESEMSYGAIAKIMDEMRTLTDKDGAIVTEKQRHRMLFPDIVLVGVGN